MTGYEALRRDAAWIDLSPRGKIGVSGDDRARLLHAMSTNNIKDLQPGHGLYAFFLTAQGRILADAYIYNRDESFLLDTEPETADKLREHLDRYIIADDATLEDETAKWAVIGIEGPASFDRAKSLGITLPEKRLSIANWDCGFALRIASTGSEGIRIFVPFEQKDDLTHRIQAENVPNASPTEARVVRLENGIPRYGEDITERYLTQETQVTSAVHTHKGCYLGQEIVERVRSRGQVHRLLTPIRVKSSVPPAPGTKLTANGKDVAEITSGVYSPAFDEVVGLAYVRTEAEQTKPEMVVAGSDPPVYAYVPESPRIFP